MILPLIWRISFVNIYHPSCFQWSIYSTLSFY